MKKSLRGQKWNHVTRSWYTKKWLFTSNLKHYNKAYYMGVFTKSNIYIHYNKSFFLQPIKLQLHPTISNYLWSFWWLHLIPNVFVIRLWLVVSSLFQWDEFYYYPHSQTIIYITLFVAKTIFFSQSWCGPKAPEGITRFTKGLRVYILNGTLGFFPFRGTLRIYLFTYLPI
jgi:hypothetical protein